MSARDGWEAVRVGRTTVYWMFSRSGFHIGSVGMPKDHGGMYAALMNFDFNGQRLSPALQVGSFATRTGAMHAVEKRSWLATPIEAHAWSVVSA